MTHVERNLHAAAMAARRFSDLALAHLDRPLPDQLAVARVDLEKALAALPPSAPPA